MTRDYYKLWYRLSDRDAYLIWYAGDEDGVFVDSSNRIPVFDCEAELDKYAAEHELAIIDDELRVHHLDNIAHWLKSAYDSAPDCDQTLAMWNLFDDIFRSIGKIFSSPSDVENKVYDKLFRGNNLPSITPKGERYEPTWSEREVRLITDKMAQGLQQFKASIYYPASGRD